MYRKRDMSSDGDMPSICLLRQNNDSYVTYHPSDQVESWCQHSLGKMTFETQPQILLMSFSAYGCVRNSSSGFTNMIECLIKWYFKHMRDQNDKITLYLLYLFKSFGVLKIRAIRLS